MFFAILFGLSMDYQVFLVSRMHEEWVHTKDNRRSIIVGQAETGSIITAAALIMIAVFGGFVLGDQRAIKLFGIGLASAVFLDAFLLRTILVPSLMHLLGDRNWFLPRWLDRVTPKVSFEPPDELESRGRVGPGRQPTRLTARRCYCGLTRSAATFSMAAAIAGCCCWSSRKRLPNIVHTVDGVVIVTVAVCRPSPSIDSSPKKSPGPKVRTTLPPTITSAAPVMQDEEGVTRSTLVRQLVAGVELVRRPAS